MSRLMPKWITDSFAEQLEASAGRIRQWAPESDEPDEMEELAAELRNDDAGETP